MKKQPKNLLNKLLNANVQENSIAKMISVYDMVPNPENHYGIREVEKLAAQIRTTRNVEQLTVKAVDDGKYMIISGHRRHAAVLMLLESGCRDVGPELSCKVVSFSAIGNKTAAEVEKQYLITANKGQRSYETVDEQLWEIDTLRPIVKKDYDEELKNGTASGAFRKYFGEYLGISSSALQRLESLRNLTESIRKDIDDGIITVTAAAELAGLEQDRQTEIVKALKASGTELTVKAIKEFKHASEPPAPTVEEPKEEELPTHVAPSMPTEETPKQENPTAPTPQEPIASVPEETQDEPTNKPPKAEPTSTEEMPDSPQGEQKEPVVSPAEEAPPVPQETDETVRRNAKEWVQEKLQADLNFAKEQLASENVSDSGYWEACIKYVEKALSALD